MAYTTHNISSITEIPALWAAFATSVGFTVNTTVPTAPTIKHPSYAEGLPFRMQTSVSGLNHEVRVDSATVVTNISVTRSPVLNITQANGGAAAVLPSKLHLIGSTVGEPFLAAVIEYGFNLYRHVYVGYMEKASNYTGGEVISGSNFWHTEYSYASSFAYNIDRVMNQPPFCVSSGLEAGGVRVIHAGSPSAWRRFFASGATNSVPSTFAATSRGVTVLGGWRDSVNTGYANVAKSPFASAAVLTPVNLLITKDIGSSTYYQQVGKPSGARMVNVEDIEPGAQVTVGSKTYIVFPCFSKQPISSFPVANLTAGSRYPAINNSLFEGMAYRID